MENESSINTFSIISITGFCIFALCVLIAVGMWGCPKYSVYEQTLSGKAKLAEADSSRQIAVCEAKAKMESAELLANAEVARAKGVAQANQIIGNSLKGHDEYLKYLWITQLEKSQHEVIYVPTEANIPILEAGRFRK